MARPAPSVERTVRLLKFLAERPKERFSLSDISRNLAFNKATCHAMLVELVNEGMLIRHPADKCFMLGPALVNLGTAAALDAHEALDIAKAEMVAIHDDLGVSCVATSLVGADVVVMARRDVDRPLFGYLPVGNRSPAVPPYAKEFMAWARPEEVAEWLDRADPRLGESERGEYLRDLEHVRRVGYHATSFGEAMMLARIVEMLHGSRVRRSSAARSRSVPVPAAAVETSIRTTRRARSWPSGPRCSTRWARSCSPSASGSSRPTPRATWCWGTPSASAREPVGSPRCCTAPRRPSTRRSPPR